jgi:hypothetical protein
MEMELDLVLNQIGFKFFAKLIEIKRIDFKIRPKVPFEIKN